MKIEVVIAIEIAIVIGIRPLKYILPPKSTVRSVDRATELLGSLFYFDM